MVSQESQHAMDAARQAVAEFMKHNGKHDTTVHERVLPAITHQTITRTEHEEIEVAVDKESHIDHFHHTLLPITDSETLEVQHRAHVLPVETKRFDHDDVEEVQRRVAAEAAKYRDEVEHVEGEHTHTELPSVAASHYHHHVHEVVIPILNKHTIEPWIVHTAHQIHEVHHLAARHHQTSMLPAVTLAEFKKQGGVLQGREDRFDFFEGEPKSSGGVLCDSQKNPLPKELRAIGHEDMIHHAQAQSSEHGAQAPPAVPTITHAPTGQGNLIRQPTGPPPAPQATQASQAPAHPLAPSGPLQHDLHPASAGPQAPQPQAPQQPQSQIPQGTPSTGHFGLMPLSLARSAGEAVRNAPMLRSMSRTPQPTTALSAPQSSQAAQQAPSQQTQQQRQGSSAGAAQPQGKAPGQAPQGQQQPQSGR